MLQILLLTGLLTGASAVGGAQNGEQQSNGNRYDLGAVEIVGTYVSKCKNADSPERDDITVNGKSNCCWRKFIV